MNIYYSLILFKIRLIFSNYKFRLIHLNICVHQRKKKSRLQLLLEMQQTTNLPKPLGHPTRLYPNSHTVKSA